MPYRSNTCEVPGASATTLATLAGGTVNGLEQSEATGFAGRSVGMEVRARGAPESARLRRRNFLRLIGGSAIWQVIRSCTCGRLAKACTSRASFERPRMCSPGR